MEEFGRNVVLIPRNHEQLPDLGFGSELGSSVSMVPRNHAQSPFSQESVSCAWFLGTMHSFLILAFAPNDNGRH